MEPIVIILAVVCLGISIVAMLYNWLSPKKEIVKKDPKKSEFLTELKKKAIRIRVGRPFPDKGKRLIPSTEEKDIEASGIPRRWINDFKKFVQETTSCRLSEGDIDIEYIELDTPINLLNKVYLVISITIEPSEKNECKRDLVFNYLRPVIGERSVMPFRIEGESEDIEPSRVSVGSSLRSVLMTKKFDKLFREHKFLGVEEAIMGKRHTTKRR